MKRVTSLLMMLLLLTFTHVVKAQISTYTFESSSGTYTELTGGTVLAAAGWDDQVIANDPLGFTFNFNGVDYTTVSVSANGYLIIGGTASMGYTPISSTVVAAGSVAAFGRDLQSIAVTGEIRSETTGTAGDYVYTVQWKNAKRYGASYVDEVLNFQIKLFQNGNKAQVVYGPITGSAYATPVHPQVGMRGATNTDYTNRTTTTNWAATTAGAINTATCTLTNLVFPANGQTFTFLPPVAGTPFPPTNPVPANNADGIATTGSLDWTFGTNTATYDLWFGSSGAMVQVVTGAAAGATGTYAYAGLSTKTNYQWQVVEHNGALTTMGPVWSFFTICSAYDLPLTENFNGRTPPALPYCWSKIVANTTNTFANVETSTLYPTSPPNSVKLYNSSADTAILILISPEISDPLTGNRITFSARGGVNYSLKVGTMSNPTDAGTFTMVGEVFPTGTHAPFQVSLANYAGTDNYIAFKHGNMGKTQTIYIDDIVIEVLPDCIEPINLTVSGITNNTADLGWTVQGNETTWDIVYGEPGFDPLTAGTTVAGITVNPYTLTGLTSASTYEFYVRADCGAKAVSAWSGPVAFTTLCDAFDLPFVENFDGAVAGTFPLCWGKSGLATTNWSISNTANALGTAPELKFGYSPSFTGEALAISPVINTTGETSVAIEFKHFFDYYAVPFTFGMKTTSDGVTWNTVWEVIDPTANVGPETVLLSVANGDVGSATFQFAFFVNGYTFNMDNWYMDDISVFVPTFGILAGTVTEATRGPIEGALITAGDYEAYTDASGNYSIANMLAASYDVTCTADGYFPVTVEDVVIIADQTTTQDFVLGYATISVDPTSLSQTLLPGATATQMLTISNTGGTEPLTWSAGIEMLDPPGKSGFLNTTQEKQKPNASVDDTDPNPTHGNPVATDAMYDLLGSFPVFDVGGTYSVATDGNFIYTGRWNLNQYDKYELDGTWIESFSIPGAGSTRDLTFDGQYFYGSPNSALIYQMDFNTKTLVSTITATGSQIRGISYDSDNDAFWVTGASFNGPYRLISRAGTVLQTVTTALAGNTGLAYDNVSDGGPFLWSYTPADGTGTHIINKTNIATGALVESFNLSGLGLPFLTDGSGGGLCLTNQVVPGKWAFMGCAQNELVWILELTDSQSWLSLDITSGVINPGESADITVTFDSGDLIDSTYLANIKINHNGQELTDGTVIVPVSLTVASASPPLAPTDPMPISGATLVPLQPAFSWTNGAGTAQVQFEIRKGTGGFTTSVYKSDWFVGSSIDLADVPVTLVKKSGYSWTVKAKNAAGIITGPKWIFTTIGAGTVSGVVTDAYSNLPLEGATITLEPGGQTTTTSASGTYSIPEVLEGTYTVTAEKSGYTSESLDVVVLHNQTVTASFALDLMLDPPFGLQAHVVDFTDVHLMWQSPGSGFAPEWLTYSGETITNSIGTDGAANFDVAARFTPDMLAGFPGGSLTKIQFVPGEPDITCTYTLKVWEGVSPPTLIYSQILPGVTADVWNEVVLTTPVPFDNTKELWFGFNSNTTAGFPAGCDDGPQVQGFGNMMFWNGAWTTLFDLAPTLTFNWAVKGYVESAKGGAVLEPIKEAGIVSTNQGTLSLNPVAMKPTVSITPNNSRALLGFNVYRDGTFLANTGIGTTEYNDLNLPAGTYAYTVKAVYDQGESVAAGPKTVAILPPPVLLAAEPDFYGVDLLWQAGNNYPTDNMPGIYSTSNVKQDAKKRTAASLPYSAGRAIGDNCTDPIIIGALPYTDANTTCGRGNYTDTTCLGNYDGGEDIFYKLTLAAETYVSITLATAVTWTGMLLTDECPPGAACIATSTNTGAGGSQIQQLLAAGTYYIMIDTWPTPACIDAFTITVEADEPCVVECPAGALPENEPCGEDLNGGCNAEVPAYTPIAIGDTYCGTAYADVDRDTDWYELVLDAPQVLTWAVTAEFPVLAFIIDGNNGCEGLAILQSATAAPCETATVTATVAPGTYWLWVGNQTFAGNPCGASNNYVATLTAEETFLSYFNVYRDGVEIAEVYGNTYYDDVDITNGEEYCYTVSQVVAEGIETAMSNELCATIPMIPVIAVNPASLTETHIIPPAQVTTQTVTLTNNGLGQLDWMLNVNLSAPADDDYCTASTTTQDEYISNVLCGSINNASGWQGLVADYTAISTSIEAGASEPIVVTNGTPWASDMVTCWVDWNLNYVFDVATNEEFILTNVGATGASFTGAIAVPAGTPAGNYRMRVRMSYSTAPVPCGVMSYGEVEDYTISVGQTWLSVDLTEGTLAPGASIDITATFNSEGLDAGIYNGALEFMSNDPVTPELMVPVTLNVELAATGTIAGHVTDATTRGPVGYVTITVDELRYTTTTDENGYYELEVQPGDYLVTASKTGYITQTAEVMVFVDETTTQNFMLEFAAPVLLYADGGIGEINLGWTGNPAVDADNAVRVSASNLEPKVERSHGATVKLPVESGRAVGDDCNNPIVIGALPYTDVNTTCGRGNSYDATCLGFYDGGEDIVYQLVITEDMTIELDLATTATWTGILITTNCPIDSTCVATITSSTGPKNMVVDLVAGTYYIMIDTWPTPTCIPEFTLTVSEYEECILEMPAGAIAEGEACIIDQGEDVTNGGCNMAVPAFTSINCGDVIWGSASTYLVGTGQNRDTDWYDFVITEPKTVTFTVTAEFPVVAGILEQVVPGEAGCDNTTGSISPYALANPCGAASVTATLTPGTYYFFVGLSVFEGYPCGTSNDYIAELTCEDAFVPYFNVIRDGATIAQTYLETYTDMDVMPDVEYCYTVSQVIEPGLVTPESNELCASMLCAAGCDYTMILTDSYGDGWNGASVTVMQGTSEIGTYTLATGDSAAMSIALCDGYETSLIWNVGSYDEETGFALLDPNGIELYSFAFTEAPIPGEFFNFMSECPAPLTQDIILPLGWSAWSSYLTPAPMNVSDVMAPVVADMVVTQHFGELFYPAYGINTMGMFSNNHGYLTKMAAEATLTISGNMADPTITLHTGWNMISVVQECSILAEGVFSNIDGFVIAWEPTGNGIYYPAGNLYTLTNLMPGKAYYVKVTEAGDYTYPGCEKSAGNVFSAPLRAANTTSWNDVTYTGINHVVVFDSKATNSLRIGDMIGAFANQSVCAGLVEYTGANLGFTLFGNDITTPAAEGFADGDVIAYKVFRAETGEEFTMDVVYSLDAPNSSTFATNGLSVITDLKLAPVSIGENTLKNLSIYPNPSSGIFNIAVSGLDTEINYVVMNAQGQEVYNGNLMESQQLDLSSEAKGVYFIKFISDSVLRIEKLVVR
ncbi:MAG: T9SS type A sorting domain-containing protein [Clostridia bacterium]|nr:T9SS type A sorting domain-containing protein [Clostridia bacterium]